MIKMLMVTAPIAVVINVGNDTIRIAAGESQELREGAQYEEAIRQGCMPGEIEFKAKDASHEPVVTVSVSDGPVDATAQKLQAICDMTAEILERDNESELNRDGGVLVKVLEKELDFDTSADERKAAAELTPTEK